MLGEYRSYERKSKDRKPAYDPSFEYLKDDDGNVDDYPDR